jgi:ethanolamine utilization protein EutN
MISGLLVTPSGIARSAAQGVSSNGGKEMKIGVVINNVWATRKDESLTGKKLLIIQLMDKHAEFKGKIIVAADLIGAGIGDRVLITRGSSCQHMKGMERSPVDAVVVGIIDEGKED